MAIRSCWFFAARVSSLPLASSDHHVPQAALRIEVGMRVGRRVHDHRATAERLDLEARTLEQSAQLLRPHRTRRVRGAA
jgi:hypothetical protein